MKTLRLFVTCGILISPVLLTGLVRGGEKKKPKNDMCATGNAQSICSAANTCGSTSSPCQVDIKRDDGDSASATPAIPSGKSNAPFCVKMGRRSLLQASLRTRDSFSILGILRPLILVESSWAAPTGQSRR